MKLSMCRAILFAKNMEAMVVFYREVLGMELSDNAESSPDFQVLEAGSVELALHGIPDRFARNIVIEDPPEPRSESVTKLVFLAEDLEGTRQELVERGAVQLERAGLNPVGETIRHDFMDPEGNIFQISNQ